jgi:putative heme-binding domain-containing protein
VPELVKDLGHPNLTVRTKATNQLVERGGQAGVEAVRAALAAGGADGASAWRRMHGLWVLERRGSLGEPALAAAAKDPVGGVRVHAQRVLGERPTLSAALRALALAGLKDADANVRRAAADALGRHPAPENVRPLLDLRHAVPADDTHLLHVVRMALRDQLRPASTWAKLPVDSWDERDRRAVADVALGVPGAEAAAYLLRHVERFPEGRDALARYAHHIARYGTAEANQALLAFARDHRPDDLDGQAALVRAIQRGTQERGARLDGAVRAWAAAVTRQLLASRRGPEVQAGIELVGTLKLEGQQPLLAELALAHRPEAQRVAALNALAALDARSYAPVLGRVLADAAAPVGLREHAANLLARANQPESQAQLLQALPAAPARLQNAIAAGLAGSSAGAEQLLQAVAGGKASGRLLQERAVALRLEQARVRDLKGRLARLTQGLPPADKSLQDLLGRRRQGFRAAKADPALGAQVFQKHCAVCHQLGGQGAKVGPQLDGIGVRGVERLLEDTLDPNRNVDQAFRLTTLNLVKGQVVSGLLLKEEGEVLVLADAQGKEVRVPKKEVEERSVSPLSPMPANFADAIPEADFYHLLAYLLRQQPDPKDQPGGR